MPTQLKADIVPIMRERGIVCTIVLLATAASAAQAQSCESLAKLVSPGVSITLASVTSTAKDISGLPPFCRVAATLKPTSDSEIGIEVWLPVTGWNGKFLAVGSGGWGGSIDYAALAKAL
jgi:feruloyl esterase